MYRCEARSTMREICFDGNCRQETPLVSAAPRLLNMDNWLTKKFSWIGKRHQTKWKTAEGYERRRKEWREEWRKDGQRKEARKDGDREGGREGKTERGREECIRNARGRTELRRSWRD